MFFFFLHSQIVGLQQYIVKPTKFDTKENNEECILSEQITTETSLTDDLVRNAGIPLETAIKQVIQNKTNDNRKIFNPSSLGFL